MATSSIANGSRSASTGSCGPTSVKSAEVHGKVHGSIRALGVVELRAGAHVEGDVAAASVIMEPGVYFNGKCTMLENGPDAVTVTTELSRPREYARDS